MRKFIQPVAITVDSYTDWVFLAEKMSEIGYRNFNNKVFDMGFPYQMLTDVRNEDPAFMILSAGYSDYSDNRVLVVTNPDLFLALAAMSEGPDNEFYLGEWVVRKDKNLPSEERGLVKYIGVEKAGRKFECNDESFLSYTDAWRKATAEEIIKHFSREVEEKTKNFEKLRDDRGVMATWVPKVDEEIWVWNEGSKRRIKQRFGFFSTNNRVMAYDASTSMDDGNFWGSVVCKKFDHFAKIDAPVSAPIEYAKNLIASELGVPAELIQIDR